MLRPEVGSGGCRDVWLACFALIATAILMPSYSASTARADEVRLRAPTSVAAAKDGRVTDADDDTFDQEYSRPDHGADTATAAEELYFDAMDKLDAGREAEAAETLNTLIARYPDTTAAARARAQLNEPTEVRPAQAVGKPTPHSVAPPPLAQASTLEQELRRNAPIQQKLRTETGDRVFFGPGSAELGSRAREALTAQAQWLIRWREFEAVIEGHADEPGSDAENIKLSERRAAAVRQRLVDQGVEPSRVSIVAEGRSMRVATCTDPDCGAQNRRAVTLVFVTGTSQRLGLTSGGPKVGLLDQGSTATPGQPPQTLGAGQGSGAPR